jgi:hypothetical protein
MPIQVICPGCKAEFKVSDKFAGKQGPCPKCKAPITIPTLPAEEAVQIHAPDEAVAGSSATKTKTGHPLSKPLLRQETKVRIGPTVAIVLGIVAALASAWFGAKIFQEQLAIRCAALVVISIPITAAGYTFLREEELEPYRGLELWLRATICAVVYAGLWCGFYFVPADLTKTLYNWFFLAPPFLLVGAGTGLACFDLDFGSGFFHYSFYVLLTLALGFLCGLSMPWASSATAISF